MEIFVIVVSSALVMLGSGVTLYFYRSKQYFLAGLWVGIVIMNIINIIFWKIQNI